MTNAYIPPPPAAPFRFVIKQAVTFNVAMHRTDKKGDRNPQGAFGVWAAGWATEFEVDHNGQGFGPGFVGIVQNTRGVVAAYDPAGRLINSLTEPDWTLDPNTDANTHPWFHVPVAIAPDDEGEVVEFADQPGTSIVDYTMLQKIKLVGKQEFAWWLVFSERTRNVARPQDLWPITSGTYIVDWSAKHLSVAGNTQPFPHTLAVKTFEPSRRSSPFAR
jgi:hypothetical protein